MALIEAIVLGGIAGAVVESGKSGLITAWGNGDGLPPIVKLFVVGVLIGIPAVNAGTIGNYATTGLTTVGAFTVARWCVASVLALWGRRI